MYFEVSYVYKMFPLDCDIEHGYVNITDNNSNDLCG